MFSPDELPGTPPPVFSDEPLLPWVWTRDLYEPTCELSDLGRRSSAPVVGYMSSFSEGCQLIGNPSSPPPEPYCLDDMEPTSTATRAADERLAAILSNQYKSHMHKNRPRWYKGHPLDTAPKCFTSWRRDEVPMISDWATYHKVTAKKAAWMGKVFSHKYYQVNGVIWTWKDPARTLLINLFTSDVMDTIEFAISSDPFRAPHLVVTHSPGEEPEYLDTYGNPDQLTSAPSSFVPNPWGCTPRQSFTGPTGMDQLLLPPRMPMYHEREDYAELCAAATINRRNIFLRVSIQFQEGLRRVRIRRQRERGRDTAPKDTSDSHITISDARSEETDFEPISRDKVASRGFSDVDAAESLMARGIMFQTRADDLALMAESAIVSEESEDEDDDDDGSMSMSPHSPTIAGDQYEILRRFGMAHYDEGEEEEEVEGREEDESEGGNSENDESAGDITIATTPRCIITRRFPWSPTSDSPSSPESPDLNSVLHTEADEQSSVSSCFIDEDSFGSGSDTSDTDEDDC